MSELDLSHLSEGDMREALLLQERLKQLKDQEQAQNSFLGFVDQIWPEFIEGRHHKIFAEKRDTRGDGIIIKC